HTWDTLDGVIDVRPVEVSTNDTCARGKQSLQGLCHLSVYVTKVGGLVAVHVCCHCEWVRHWVFAVNAYRVQGTFNEPFLKVVPLSLRHWSLREQTHLDDVHPLEVVRIDFSLTHRIAVDHTRVQKWQLAI